MIMLIGLVTKNGILIVEFANQKREEGLDKVHAVLEASRLRLRPILMTSLANVVGAWHYRWRFRLGAASTKPGAPGGCYCPRWDHVFPGF